MNNTILKENSLTNMKILVSELEKKEKKIYTIWEKITCFGSTEKLQFELRKKTQKHLKLSRKLNKLIKKL